MKKISIFIVFATSFCCLQGQNLSFTPIYEIPNTPIENQERTSTCWSFATLSFLECEILRNTGEMVDLSEMYTARKLYNQKAERYIRYHGKNNFSQGGLAHDVIYCLESYGLMPEMAYVGNPTPSKPMSDNELLEKLKDNLDKYVVKNKIQDTWKQETEAILDTYLGKLDTEFIYDNKTYTAKSFAQKWNLIPSNYYSFSSFTHHPFYEQFILEVPDNHNDGKFYNVPIDELERIVDNALAQNYTITWDADVSDKGFMFSQGIAIVPYKAFNDLSADELKLAKNNQLEEAKITQQMRQEAFDNYELTDDHLMHIVGLVQDNNGKQYYKIKNSWGSKNIFDGYMYISKSYFRMNTVSILLNKNGIQNDILNKLK